MNGGDSEFSSSGTATAATNVVQLAASVAAKQIEREFGRRADGPRWGPRPIDVDILFYDDQQIQSADLIIPHAQAHQRRFVLEPLAELAPEFRHPVLGQSVRELLAQLTAAA